MGEDSSILVPVIKTGPDDDELTAGPDCNPVFRYGARPVHLDLTRDGSRLSVETTEHEVPSSSCPDEDERAVRRHGDHRVGGAVDRGLIDLEFTSGRLAIRSDPLGKDSVRPID